MASSKFGGKLNPYRCLREPLGVKGARQSVVITNNPSIIDQNQQLLVRFPNLGTHDVIVPGTARLAFRITLNSEDVNRTVVQNLGHAIVKKTVIKISGNEVTSVDDSDAFNCYGDLWKTALEWKNDQYQGIDTKVEVTIEGISNQLFSQGMHAYQMWDEARKLFAASPGRKRHPEVVVVAKDLGLADISLGELLTSKFALWLDLRTTDYDRLHGSGRRIENASEGVTIQFTKTADAAGALNIYLYIIVDAQLNLEDGRFVSAVY